MVVNNSSGKINLQTSVTPRKQKAQLTREGFKVSHDAKSQKTSSGSEHVGNNAKSYRLNML